MGSLCSSCLDVVAEVKTHVTYDEIKLVLDDLHSLYVDVGASQEPVPPDVAPPR